jgi:hypothetical protein
MWAPDWGRDVMCYISTVVTTMVTRGMIDDFAPSTWNLLSSEINGYVSNAKKIVACILEYVEKC